ncbi:hypothetical protein B0H16DRAFT_1243040, partial [Mycena metata]
IDAEHPPMEAPTTKKCSKPWCKTLLPIDEKKKACAKCRELDSKNQRARKERVKAADTTTTTLGSRKRRRGSLDSADDRPPTRPRTDEYMDGIEIFSDAESFFDALRADFKSGDAVNFRASYPISADPLVSPKERVQMVAAEIWNVSSYRFTVRDNKELASGHRTRYWCSQDEARKKKTKASQDPQIKNRDTVGMKRYPCGSKLVISCRTSRGDADELTVTVDLKHAAEHVSYTD